MPMSEIDTPVEGLAAEGAAGGTRVDGLRLRSFVGLAVSFALSSNQLIGWLAYPVFGRASDRTRSAVGRRAPYMAAGLFVMGACTYSYTLVGGYWPILALIGAVRL